MSFENNRIRSKKKPKKRRFHVKESVFRCEEMALCAMYLGADTAYECVAALGELGAVEFKDIKKWEHTYHHLFANKIRICSEMERRLRYFEMEIFKVNDIEVYEIEECYEALKPLDMSDLATVLMDLENELLFLTDKYKTLMSTNLDLSQMEEILYKTDEYMRDMIPRVSLMRSNDVMDMMASQDEFARRFREETGIKLGFVAGVIPQTKVHQFEVMLYRVGRGNMFYKIKPVMSPFDDPKYPEPIYKSVFLVYFHGEELRSRMYKICNGFKVTLYDCPENFEERLVLKNTISSRKKDIAIGLRETEDLRRKVLLAIARNLRKWQMMVMKMKSVFYVLNGLDMDTSSTYMVAECWIPVSHFELVRRTLEKTNERARGSIPPVLIKIPISEEPPTYNATNKYSKVIQQLVDSYGYAKYGEVNPTPFTVVTFPFLFGVMFGDLGHGFLMFAAGMMFILLENSVRWQKMGEIMNIFFEGRYLIMLMGLFSMYTGLMYNECFSISINLFGSAWKINLTENVVMSNEEIDLNPEVDFTHSPYPFGMDPVWQLSDNLLTVSNSLKMKLSIVFGVIHMMFGIFLGLWNFLYFKCPESIIGEFIPHVLFLSSIFLYMVFLIIFKWVMYGPKGASHRRTNCAPSILSTMILMAMLQKPKANRSPNCRPEMYPIQYYVQICLLATAGLCIPWMLLFKPIYKLVQRRHKMSSHHSSFSSQNVSIGSKGSDDSLKGDELEPEETTSEMFIYQGIHTIEFVLGCVSHTASYLRLWALSLAHAQLSAVLWTMVMRAGLSIKWPLGSLGAFVAFGVWAVFTFAILVLMEGLSAFLHTLRLHWVEFQSKFYSGLGHGFVPFCFKTILKK